MSIFCKVSHQKDSFKSEVVLLTLKLQKNRWCGPTARGTNRGGHELTVVGGTELVQLSLLSLSDKVLDLL